MDCRDRLGERVVRGAFSEGLASGVNVGNYQVRTEY
jgi:hypothetical protein